MKENRQKEPWAQMPLKGNFQREAMKQLCERQMSSERNALLEAIPGWTWERSGYTKQFSDICPNCKQNIQFDKENTSNLNNEHDDGKGGKCRFQGAVVDGKIQANVAKVEKKKCFKFSDVCPKCKQNIQFDKANTPDLDNEHDDGEGGKCRFRGAVVEGKIQANVPKTDEKRCFKCTLMKARPEYHEDQWNKTGENANRRKCKTCQ